MSKLGLLLFFIGLEVNGQMVSTFWVNDYDDSLNFTCPTFESISVITSMHSDATEDRVWYFSCKKTFDSKPECFWTNYVNYFDEKISFTCPPNQVISGVESYHSNQTEDRRWKYYCCRVNFYCNKNCQWTPYVNYFDEHFTYYVPGLNYLTGVVSYHDNTREDRRWSFQYCTRSECS